MITSLLIGTLCTISPNIQYNACDAASRAYSIQSGWEKRLTLVDNYLSANANVLGNKIELITGKDIWILSGITYKFYRENCIYYTFNSSQVYGLPSITPNYQFDNRYTIRLNWSTNF